MILMRVRGNHIINQIQAQLIPDKGIHPPGGSHGAPIYHHRRAVADDHGAIALSHIQEPGVQFRPGLHRCQDQNQQNKDNKDNKDKQDQQKQEQQQKQDEQKQEQQQKQQMSKENAEQLLNAAMQEEKQTQERMKKAQQQPQKRRLEKNW
jgi:hypothetical protein